MPDAVDDWAPGAKELRDHFFHLPERIHAWATETDVAPWDRNLATFPIGFNFDPREFPGSNVQIGEGLPREAVFRNRGGDEFLFWDARLSVRRLVNGLQMVADSPRAVPSTASHLDSHHGPLQ